MQGSKTLFDQLVSWAAKQPEKVAIQETDKTITYGEMIPAIHAVAKEFGAAGQTIVVSLPGGVLTSVIWLTAWLYGHRLVPVSPASTKYELEQLIDTLDTKTVIFIGEEPLKVGRQIKSEVLAGLVAKGRSSPANFAPRDGTLWLSTSGSTGTPKQMALTTSQCVITARNIIDAHKLTPDDVCFTALPFHHINAPIVSLLSTILSGGRLAIMPQYHTSQWWEAVRAADPTWINTVPTMMAMVLTKEPPAELDLSRVRFVRTASAPLPVATLKAFEAKYHLPVIETYGISEAASTIVANPVPPARRKPGSVGLPAGIELVVRVGESQAKSGIVGEVFIKGDNVIKGYVGHAEPDAFVDDWFRTGDLGYLDEDGFLFLTGRSKDVIIRGGENIFPREIEEVLITHPDAQEVVVVGQTDPLYGQKVVAYVRSEKSVTPEFEASLVAHARAHLSSPKVPVELYIVDDFPRTKTGKVNRPLLKTGRLS